MSILFLGTFCITWHVNWPGTLTEKLQKLLDLFSILSDLPFKRLVCMILICNEKFILPYIILVLFHSY